MEADYQRADNPFRDIDYEVIFTGVCVMVIVFILALGDDDCDYKLKIWLLVKGVALTFRLSLKGACFHNNQDSWFKIVILLIKLFSIAWIAVGLFWLVEEDTPGCYWDSVIYTGVLAFIIMFLVGAAGFLLMFIVAIFALNRAQREE